MMNGALNVGLAPRRCWVLVTWFSVMKWEAKVTPVPPFYVFGHFPKPRETLKDTHTSSKQNRTVISDNSSIEWGMDRVNKLATQLTGHSPTLDSSFNNHWIVRRRRPTF